MHSGVPRLLAVSTSIQKRLNNRAARAKKCPLDDSTAPCEVAKISATRPGLVASWQAPIPRRRWPREAAGGRTLRPAQPRHPWEKWSSSSREQRRPTSWPWRAAIALLTPAQAGGEGCPRRILACGEWRVESAAPTLPLAVAWPQLRPSGARGRSPSGAVSECPAGAIGDARLGPRSEPASAATRPRNRPASLPSPEGPPAAVWAWQRPP